MKRHRMDVNLEELDRVLDHAREVPLSEPDYDPGLEYIEASNEPDLSNHLDESTYYAFFQDFYRAVNAANAALNPAIPLGTLLNRRHQQ